MKNVKISCRGLISPKILIAPINSPVFWERVNFTLKDICWLTGRVVTRDTSRRYPVFYLSFSYACDSSFYRFRTYDSFREARKTPLIKFKFNIVDYQSYQDYITIPVKPNYSINQKYLNGYFNYCSSDNSLRLFSTDKALFNTFEYVSILKCILSVNGLLCMYKLPLPDI